ncbi:MAG: transketolase C-terminal domain-containing protein, partial [Rhodospirillales bacterium]
TGSEVELAVAARLDLQAAGIPTAVVSMPCQELFDQQDAAYKAAVLGAPGGLRVSIEAGITWGWERYIGDNGVAIGMTGFGASAPADQLYRHFGITSDAVVEAVKARI